MRAFGQKCNIVANSLEELVRNRIQTDYDLEDQDKSSDIEQQSPFGDRK